MKIVYENQAIQVIYSHFPATNLIYYLEFFPLSCIDMVQEISAEMAFWPSALGINVIRYFLQLDTFWSISKNGVADAEKYTSP